MQIFNVRVMRLYSIAACSRRWSLGSAEHAQKQDKQTVSPVP